MNLLNAEASVGGTPAVPVHVMKVETVGPDGKPLAAWDWRTLSALAPSAIVNDFPYNRFKSGALWARGWNGRERDCHPPSAGRRDLANVGRAAARHRRGRQDVHQQPEPRVSAYARPTT